MTLEIFVSRSGMVRQKLGLDASVPGLRRIYERLVKGKCFHFMQYFGWFRHHKKGRVDR